MQHINSSYTTYFNIRHDRYGHLFQGRYKSILVEVDEYAKELSRYIHLNPVRARLVKTPEEYQWSSCIYYTDKKEAPAWLYRDFILGYFGERPSSSQKNYPEEDDPDYPLLLTSSKSSYYLHSSYRWIEKLRKMRPHPKVEIHPETAEKYRINEGDEVIIETRNGEITQVTTRTDTIDPKIINASHGWWFPEESPETQYGWERSNLNMLTSAEKFGKEYGTPNLKGIGCRISGKVPAV